MNKFDIFYIKNYILNYSIFWIHFKYNSYSFYVIIFLYLTFIHYNRRWGSACWCTQPQCWCISAQPHPALPSSDLPDETASWVLHNHCFLHVRTLPPAFSLLLSLTMCRMMQRSHAQIYVYIQSRDPPRQLFHSLILHSTLCKIYTTVKWVCAFAFEGFLRNSITGTSTVN